MSTPADEERRAKARQLAKGGLSNRAIGRLLGVHHSTVARDLAATPEPDAPADAPPAEPPAPVDAPPTLTSGERPAPRLLHDLPGWLVQDLNVLMDPRTGALPGALLRAIHAAAEERRATWCASAERRARHADAVAR